MLSVIGVSKRFGSLEALKPLSVDFVPGEVHSVVGENGAGKSTLMNILGGFLSPTSGTISLDKLPLPVGDSHRCRAMGIEMVHQHFKLVPAFTIEENLKLSQLGVGSHSIEAIKQKATEFGWEIPWSSRVQDISVGVQQRVEILKCVATNPSVVIFDEPTAVLAKDEVADLIGFLKHLAGQGKIVILIAHKIAEVMSASDRITVLRRGNHMGTLLRSEIDANKLVDLMVGGKVESTQAEQLSSGPEVPNLILDEIWAKDDQHQDVVKGVKMMVGKGRVFGIGGVDGNGQIELAEVLAGVRNLESGSITFEDHPLNYDSTYVGYVPQDRQTDGLAINLDLVQNIAVSGIRNGERFSSKDQFDKAESLINEYAIKAKSPRDLAKQLSGGNQQKVILSRVLDQSPKILVVVNPTRGLDVKAAQFVHQKIQDAATKGAYVIVFTTDRDELFALTNEQWFMSRGRLFAGEKEALAS